jgi:hypothetical protein
MFGSNAAAVSALLFACYWMGLQFVGLDEHSVAGGGSFYFAAIYIFFAIGMFKRVKGFAIGCALVSFGLLVALLFGAGILFGFNALTRAATCFELRCAYEFWGMTVGALATGIFSFAALRCARE